MVGAFDPGMFALALEGGLRVAGLETIVDRLIESPPCSSTMPMPSPFLQRILAIFLVLCMRSASAGLFDSNVKKDLAIPLRRPSSVKSATTSMLPSRLSSAERAEDAAREDAARSDVLGIRSQLKAVEARAAGAAREVEELCAQLAAARADADQKLQASAASPPDCSAAAAAAVEMASAAWVPQALATVPGAWVYPPLAEPACSAAARGDDGGHAPPQRQRGLYKLTSFNVTELVVTGLADRSVAAGTLIEVNVSFRLPPFQVASIMGMQAWLGGEDHIIAVNAISDTEANERARKNNGTLTYSMRFAAVDVDTYELSLYWRIFMTYRNTFSIVQIGRTAKLSVTAGSGARALPTAECNSWTRREGRYVSCRAMGGRLSNCLRDGWVFVPYDCFYPVSRTVRSQGGKGGGGEWG